MNNKIFDHKNIGEQYVEIICFDENNINTIKSRLLNRLPNLEISHIKADHIYIKLSNEGLGISGKELDELIQPEAFYQHFRIEPYDNQICKVYEKFSYNCLNTLEYINDENGQPVAAFIKV